MVRAARAFLAGKNRSPLEMLERDMKAASKALQFERAAELRDRLDTLTWLHSRLERMRKVQQECFVYPIRGHEGDDLWYLIRSGRVAVALPAPQDAEQAQAAREVIEATYRHRTERFRRVVAEEMDVMLLVAAWFRRNPEERSRVLSPHEAMVTCDKHGEPPG